MSIAGKIQRAEILHDHHRNEEALVLLNEILAEDPNCEEAHYQKTWVLLEIPGHKKEALESIHEAITLDPDFAPYTATKSIVLNRLDRSTEALTAAQTAIAQDPDLPMAWIAKAGALGDKNEWAKAEEAARKALELDPDETTAANLLTLYLRMQGKLDASSENIEDLLSEDAEDPFTHANAGWVALQQGDYAKAEKHCLESLRIDPENEYARSGLLEAYKARSLFYRLYLKWVFFIQKFADKGQWIITIGIYIAYRVLRGAMNSIHPVLGAILGILFLIFVFGSWIASGLGHFIILKDRIARLTLKPAEKRDAWAVGGAFCLGLVIVIVGLTLAPIMVAAAGGVLMISSIPASRIFLNGALAGQVIFSLITLSCYGLAVATAATNEISYAWAAVAIGFLSTWLGLIPNLEKDPDD